ncbi:MAG: trypsin-like peptidase domain-containing protein [Clostridia bacterium]|nr:trypsin-like peptidase domain-containing protein [Clostridia bacterium]
MNLKKEIAASALLMGVLAAILFVGKDTGGAAKTVYAQGEYVQLLAGTASPFADVADAVMPCVIGVSNRANTYSIISGQTELVEQSTGSGVVITTQGHVVTNYHVVEGASDVQVLWQGQYLKAEIVGVDELTDLAVLRVTEDIALPAVKMGNALDVRVGDWAIVIGNPLGKQFADTVTVGVVSALNREIDGSSIVKMLQTDAAINSGNSGGGMFNTRGELIGIPSLKFSASGRRGIASIEGIAMAIPMDVVQPVVNSLIQYGKVTRPKLGIAVMTLRGSEEPEAGRLPAGVYVSAVTEGGAAQKAGILPDDIIIRVDGERVMLHTDLTNHIAGKQPGDQVVMTVYRIEGLSELTVQDRVPKGEELEFTIELQMPSETSL